MRTPIYAGLFTVALTLQAVAENTSSEIYGAYQAEISTALKELSLTEEIVTSLEEDYPDLATAPFGVQTKLTNQAIKMMATVDKMRQRSKVTFEEIEHQYELFCLKSSTFLLLCAQPRLYYKLIIKDTIVFGGVYQDYEERSLDILSALGK